MRSEVAAKVYIATKLYLAALWAVCVYRALTQSIVHDEALNWQFYLAGPPGVIFQFFEANHHFLNTVLMWLCVSIFGASEWSLRLPALAAAALYFCAVYRLSRYAFGGGLAFSLAIGLATLNPFILDFMVAARGYGMALALWMWALALLLPYIEDAKSRTPRRLAEASVALALSVVANLVFVIPAAVLAALAFWLLRKPSPQPAAKNASKKASKTMKRRAAEEPSLVMYFALPIAGIAALFLLISPVASAAPGDFYAGAATLAESLRSVAAGSMTHGGPWAGSRAMEWARDAMGFVVAPAIVLAGLVVGALRRNLFLLLSAGAAAGSALAILLAHVAAGMLYPMDRTGIYFLPLVTFALIGVGSAIRVRPAAVAIYALGGLLLVHFALEWNVRKFFVWQYDADTKDLANTLAVRASGGQMNVRVGASWVLEPALNFYRVTRSWTWIQPVTRAPLGPGFDFYALAPWDHAIVNTLGLKTLYQGTTSGTLLAGY